MKAVAVPRLRDAGLSKPAAAPVPIAPVEEEVDVATTAQSKSAGT